MKNKSFSIVISVIHSEWDDALGSEFPLMGKDGAKKGLHQFIESAVADMMPEERAYTIIAGMKIEEECKQ